MKISGLEFKSYAAKKPMESREGDYLTAAQMLSSETRTATLSSTSMLMLPEDSQIDLTLKRYEYEPDFKFGYFNGGVYSKRQLMGKIENPKDRLGQELVSAEMAYLNELRTTLAGGSRSNPWPTVPKPIVPDIPYWRTSKRYVDIRLQMRAVFCECTTDNVTRPFANYRISEVHPVFAKRGFRVIVLKDTDDIKAYFAPEAKKTLTTYLSGVGHGNYGLYTGHMGNRILEVSDYDADEVKGKALHFLSCKTARDLGPDTVQMGALSYAGYIDNFVLQWDDSSSPINEFLLFAQCGSVFDLMMANGSTTQNAFDATIQAFNAAISQVPNQVAATYLTMDRDRFRLIGDGQAKISPYRYVRIRFPVRLHQQEDALVSAGELK